MNKGILALMLILAIVIISISAVAVYFLFLQTPLVVPTAQDQPAADQSTAPPTYSYGTKIGSWNLQIFGDAKAENQELMNFYANTIKNYDVFIIQEIRDADGSSFDKLCQNLDGYNCFTSERAGTTSSKEQYGIIWKSTYVLSGFTDYTGLYQNEFERPPLKFTINSGSSPLIVYTIHTKPDNVVSELKSLEAIAGQEQEPTIIMGDLNAGCSYFNHPSNSVFANWTWEIGDEADTTSGTTNCAYDRIIANIGASEMVKSVGIFKDGITADISDHYLVWAEVY